MFQSLKTPIKLGLLLVLLMVFLLSSYLFTTKYSEYQYYQQAEKMLPFSGQIEDLISSLAEERGLHDLQQPSQSKKILNRDNQYLMQQLHSARAKADMIIQSSQIIKKIHAQYPNFKSLANSLQNLSTIRHSKASFQAYTDLIRALMEFQENLLNQVVFPLSNSHLMINLDNLVTLTKLKEYTEQERGIMMHVVFSQTLKTENYFKLSGNINMQQVYINALHSSEIKTNMALVNRSQEVHSVNQLIADLASNHYIEFNRIRQQVKNQFYLQQQLLKLLTSGGYTGFIHHFKNYILRRQPSAYWQAKQEYERINQLLKHLSTELKLTPQQKKDIQDLQQTFEQYNQNLDKMKELFNEGYDTNSVDSYVKVDDTNAKVAIEELQAFYTSIPPKVWWNQATQRINSIDENLKFFMAHLKTEITERQQKLEHQVAILLLGLLFLTFLVVLIARYIFIRIQQLINLSDALNQMSKNHDFDRLPIIGKDEIASLSHSFNKLIKERSAYEHDLWERSNLDSLTQLPNRQYLQELLGFCIKDCKRQKNKLGVLFIDLDGFKNINDTKGHHIGDKLLKTVAERLTSAVRESDVAARLGGDEFVVLLPDLKSVADIENIAHKIIAVLYEPINLDANFTVKISASLGITLYPDDADNASTLLMNADLAMYEAKIQGKNRYAFYQSSLSHNLTFEQQVSDALNNAADSEKFEEHGFFLTYQPIVDSHQKLAHFEALIRWEDPVLGFLPPVQFIGVAEKNHTIIRIGQWVIREVAQQLAQWQQTFNQQIYVSINLSSVQSQNGFASVQTVLEELKAQDFAVDSLHFEITESLLMQNSHMIRTGLEKLKGFGCKIYLDDFGTGFSSLSYLKLFPMDVLKIDRSFIMDLMIDQQDQELVNTILSIAQVLKMQVVAEGVETQEQFDYLKEHDCDFIQGYLVSKPLKGREATAFLQQKNKMQ